MNRPTLAIVSAMHEELQALQPLLQHTQVIEWAGRRFHLGQMHGQQVVLALTGIGKVAAATTTTLLLHEFDVKTVVFTGVAGGLHPAVKVGDVVVGDHLLQHDLDVSPLFPRFEVPHARCARFGSDPALAEALAQAAQRCLKHHHAQVHRGLVVSGDQFISSAAQSNALRSLLPDALAVEMEGAAVAQVCADFGRPFGVIRTISDRADDTAHLDFNRFLADVASHYTRDIISDWLQHHARG